jgi:hypothetical protein
MIPPNFYKVVKDFIRDILITFPELEMNLTSEMKHIHTTEIPLDIEQTQELKESYTKVYDHVLREFPLRFFDILYEKSEVFQESRFFLPGIDFKSLWNENITEKTKNIIWKYLKLILLMIHGGEGDNSKLFENINMDEIKEKINETMKDIHTFFDTENMSTDPEEMKDHLNGLMTGKIGSLAKEIAEESIGDINDPKVTDDTFKKMFSDPSQMIGLMHNIGDKIDKKIKSGDLKESELMEEAMDMIGKMKNMPGMKQFEQMFNKFGGGKMDLNAMQSQMNAKLNQTKTKERLQNKLKKKKESEPNPEIKTENVNVPTENKKKKKKKKKNKENIHDSVLDE